jgi:translocation and assembly module TamB
MKWRKRLAWGIAAILVFSILVATGGYLFLKSRSFRQLAVRQIVETVNSDTGGQATIGSLDFDPLSLTAHLRNIVLRGDQGSNQEPPLLRIDELTLRLTIQSVLSRKLQVRELLIAHPSVYFRVDPEGRNNLPHPAASGESSGSAFDLGIGHLAISDGDVDYNNQKMPISADLRDLGVEVHFEPVTKRYAGSASYANGSLHYGDYAALPHSLNAAFSATPAMFSLDSAVLKVGSSSATLHASATGYDNPVISGTYDIRLGSRELASLSTLARPQGDLNLVGTIYYQHQGNIPWLRNIVLDGQLHSDDFLMSSSEGSIALRKLQGRYDLNHGALRATNVEAETLGGIVRADLEIDNLDATPVSRLQASLNHLSVREIQHAVRRSTLKQVAILSTIDGTVRAHWGSAPQDMWVRSDLSLRMPAQTIRTPSGIPLAGTVHAEYDRRRNTLTLHQTSIHTPELSAIAEGAIGNQSQLQVQASTSDLRRAVDLVSAFQSTPPHLPEVSGSGSFDFLVQGSVSRPVISGQAKAQNLHVGGSNWTSVEVSLRANPSQLVVSKASLVSAGRGTAAANANVTLRNWSYVASDPFAANASLHQLSIDDLQRVANWNYPVHGDLSANISVKGSQLEPSGSGSVQITNASVYSEPVQMCSLKFQAKNGVISSTASLVASPGAPNATLTYTPKSKSYVVRVDAPSLLLEKFHFVQAGQWPLRGQLALAADGTGTTGDPQLNVTLHSGPLSFRQKSISAISGQIHVANHQANFDLNSEVAKATLEARGSMNLTPDYAVNATLDTSVVPLDVLLATYMTGMPDGLRGQSEFHVTVKGPLANPSQLDAHLTIPTFNASYDTLNLAAAEAVQADYSQSVLTVHPVEIRGTGTSLRVEGTLPFRGAAKPSLNAQGSVDLRVLRIFSPNLRSSGLLSLNVHASSSGDGPQLEGQANLQNVALATSDVPLGVEKLNGTLAIADNKVQVSQLTAQVGGGQLSMRGLVAYRPKLQFDLTLQGSSVQLLYPDGLRTLLDCNLTLAGTSTASQLTGRVLIDSLSFTPDFDLAKFGDQLSTSTASASAPGFTENLRLAVGVQSKENLSANSSQISVAGRVNLQVVGTAADPVITGRTDLNAGEIFYRSARYQLRRGIITFNNPTETSPVLDVAVSTNIEQYNLTLNLRGPFNKLTTSYVSDPPLATADIINLIARGKTTEESGASQSADSMIASQAASQFSSSVQKFAGLSSLQIDPLLGGDNQNPSARIAIQQRVTKNFLFSFSTDVSTPGAEIVEGDYQISKRWSVTVTRDQLGGVSVDGKLHTKF